MLYAISRLRAALTKWMDTTPLKNQTKLGRPTDAKISLYPTTYSAYRDKLINMLTQFESIWDGYLRSIKVGQHWAG